MQETAFVVAVVALFMGIVFLLCGLYLDHLLLIRVRTRATRSGYTSVPDSAVGDTAGREMVPTSHSRHSTDTARVIHQNGYNVPLEAQV